MFIDIHAHAYWKPQPVWNGQVIFATPQQLLERYRQVQIKKAVLLPLIGPEVYIPQSNEEILQMAQQWPDVFIPFCNLDPRALTNSADAPLGDVLRYYRDCGCKGIGEVMPNLPFRNPLVHNLFRHCQDVGFPLIFDISDRVGGAYGLVDEAGLPQLEECLRIFPKLKIFGHGPAYWAEIAQLETPGDRSRYPNYPLKEEGVVPKLFRRYPNMYGDLSAGSGYNALNRDHKYAVQFLNEFQDRLFFGTDICHPDQPTPLIDLLIRFKNEGKISADAFEKIAYRNAAKLLDIK